MEKIINEISGEILKAELTKEKFLRKTNKNNKELYIVDANNSPNVMQEIARLRELTFRKAGGGTGRSFDIDNFDLSKENPYQQLIVWDDKEQQILGGYRFIFCKNAPKDENGNIKLTTSRLFKFSNEFEKNYLPNLIELGRSFIRPMYQQASKISRKSLFTLDNLWDGLGALIVDYKSAKYFFGKVTMYKDFDKKARDLILYFFKKYFYDDEKLVLPYENLNFFHKENELSAIINEKNYENDYKILSKKVRELGENIPPLINSYMNLSPTMKVFGTTNNKYFGNVEETAIMIKIGDIYNKKKERHIITYKKSLKI